MLNKIVCNYKRVLRCNMGALVLLHDYWKNCLRQIWMGSLVYNILDFVLSNN